jgi:hypothetical protein
MNVTFMSWREHAFSLSRWTLAVSILLVSGCGYTPNLIPSGAPAILKYPGIRVLVKKQDYPIVLTVKREQEQVNVHWVRKGGLIWGERPGSTAAQWRFVMSVPGLEGDPLCITDWKTDSADSNKEFTEEVCKFKVEDKLVKVENYLATALLGEVLFRLDGDPTDEDSYRTVNRAFYLADK